jgi:outer membrane protein OmpA-like peptidoglycan-associated protein
MIWRRFEVGVGFGLALSLLLTSPANAQDKCAPVTHSKAEKLLEKGTNKDKYGPEERADWLAKAIEEDPACLACRVEIAEVMFSRFKRSGQGGDEAGEHAQAVIEACPSFSPAVHYISGALAYADRQWADAEDAFLSFLQWAPNDAPRSVERQIEEVRDVLPLIAFERSFWANADAFDPEVVTGVNTPADEFLPALSPDGSLLFFTRRSMHKAKGDVVSREIEVFEMARRLNAPTAFSESSPLPSPFNAGAQYGGASISVDNRELWIAASNPVPSNPNNVDLFVTTYEVIGHDEDNHPLYEWGQLEPATSFNTETGWEAQPALSSDGNALYFARIDGQTTPDPNGNPTMDLMVSSRLPDGGWSTPTPLPAPINSNANDKAPFLHPDGKTLFFASDRTPGGGGYDLWMTRKDMNGNWSSPENIGAPINSPQDEHGMVVDIDGKTAFFAGRRTGTKALDVLAFPLPEALQPEEVILIQGALRTPEGLPAREASVTLEVMGTDVTERRELQVRPDDGRYATVVTKPADDEHLVLTTEGEGVAFDAVEIQVDSRSAVAVADLEARPLAFDEPMEMRNIEFPVDGSALDAGSMRLLKSFASYLHRHPSFHARLEGHTDNTGDPEANIVLSANRAEAVKDFLIEQGVGAERLEAKGFGAARPIADNNTSAGKSANRRTEFAIFVP